ncbi:MAG: pilus assembly protein PilM [Candidatus Omnitrophota bacterium]
MGKKHVGLFLGTNSIGGALVDRKKIVSLANFELSSLEEETRVENLNEEVKWEALINRTLRDIGSEERDVYIALSDSQFILRSFEMPLMRKSEIESSISYEIGKYIPFKVEELMWDYAFVRFPKEKKVTVSFVGIQEQALERINGMVARLGLQPAVIEPACISLVRVLKSRKKIAGISNFALLDVEQSQASLTFFYYDLPVFNRNFSVPRKEGALDVDKFLEILHLSFQYFKREFEFYVLENIFVVADVFDEHLVSLLRDELQAKVDLFTPYDLTEKPDSSIDSLKALGCAGIDFSTYKFKPVVKRTAEYFKEIETVSDMPLKTGPLAALFGVCAVVCLGLFVYNNQSLAKRKSVLDSALSALAVPDALQGRPAESIDEMRKSDEEKIKTLSSLTASYKPLFPLLERINILKPKGLWLDNFQLTKGMVNIKGRVYKDDNQLEQEAVDYFITNLKEDVQIKEIFPVVEIVSQERQKEGEYYLTSFSMRLVF